MRIYGLDPGTTHSALVWLEPLAPIAGDILPNSEMLARLRQIATLHPLVIEQVECFGMSVGREVFETVKWAGRFCEAWESRGAPVHWMPRRTVKLHICSTMQAKDQNIRRVLLDRFGGDASARKGGQLAGIRTHLWSALALAVTFQEQRYFSEVTHGEAIR